MAAAPAPASSTQRVTQMASSSLRTVLIVTKKSATPMRISMKRRSKKVLAGLCVSPSAKLKTASSMKSATSNPMGEAMNSSCWPMTSLTSHTKKSAPSATSRKVGLKPMEKGRLANGMRKTTPHSATKPQCVSLRIITPPMSAAAATSASSGPAMPMKRVISSSPATSTDPSTIARTTGFGEKRAF